MCSPEFDPTTFLSTFLGDTAELEKEKCEENASLECERVFDNEMVSDQFWLYLWLVLGHAVTLLAAYWLNYHVLCNAGQNIHDMAITGIVKSPIRFFDRNPAGRILNRFSKVRKRKIHKGKSSK